MGEAMDTVRVRQEGQAVTIAVRGKGTMRHAAALRSFCEEALAGGALTIELDLRDCIYLDSTFLGTLLSLKRAAMKQGTGAEIVLVSLAEDCRRVLSHMGMLPMFRVVERAEQPAEGWADLDRDVERRKVLEHLAEAHGELAQLPGSSGKVFRAVAERMAKEVAEERAKEEEKPLGPCGG
jgi:anti-sigma B factor antagonist